MHIFVWEKATAIARLGFFYEMDSKNKYSSQGCTSRSLHYLHSHQKSQHNWCLNVGNAWRYNGGQNNDWKWFHQRPVYSLASLEHYIQSSFDLFKTSWIPDCPWNESRWRSRISWVNLSSLCLPDACCWKMFVQHLQCASCWWKNWGDFLHRKWPSGSVTKTKLLQVLQKSMIDKYHNSSNHIHLSLSDEQQHTHIEWSHPLCSLSFEKGMRVCTQIVFEGTP